MISKKTSLKGLELGQSFDTERVYLVLTKLDKKLVSSSAGS